MALKVKKQVYDDVHGYIELTELETRIIDTPIFQRLRHISQMGPAHYVYPGATHTRFSHCMGAMFMMQQFLDNVRSDGELLTTDDEEIQKLRLAALLHDVGHYPMSHTIEDGIVNRLKGMGHEQLGAAFVERFLPDKLDTYKPHEITDIFTKKRKGRFSLLISSAFDADKSDYLLRDSYHTGVLYGRINIERLMRTMSIEDDRIVFSKDESVVESFLIGRYHMYRSVYHHKTAVGFALMADRIFEMLVKEGRIAHPNDLLKSSELDAFSYNDNMFYSAMQAYVSNGKNRYLKELAGMFLLRKPFAAAHFDPQPSEKGKIPKTPQRIKEIEENEKAKQAFAQKSGVDEEWIFPTYLRPLSLVDESSRIYTSREGGTMPLSENSGLILGMIGKKTLYDARVYTKKEHAERLRKAMKGW
ncbi:MAG: HD domain-containing protein [Candidatus Micrarchaeota archaeon]|nr:HD domain-containing protein [Candidatus Micrarchaeota archaeon]